MSRRPFGKSNVWPGIYMHCVYMIVSQSGIPRGIIHVESPHSSFEACKGHVCLNSLSLTHTHNPEIPLYIQTLSHACLREHKPLNSPTHATQHKPSHLRVAGPIIKSAICIVPGAAGSMHRRHVHITASNDAFLGHRLTHCIVIFS